MSTPAPRRKGHGNEITVALIGAAALVLVALIGGAVTLLTSGRHSGDGAQQSSPAAAATTPSPTPSASASGPSFQAVAPPPAPEAILPDPNPDHDAGVAGVAYNPAGTVLATGDVDGTTYLWGTSSNTIIRPLANPISQGVYGVAFSPDGTLVAADNQNKACSVTVWNAQTREHVATLRDPQGTSETSGIAFSPDGAILAAADDNGGIYLWNTRTWGLARPQPLLDPGTRTLSGIAFNPQGTLLAAADKNGGIYLWNTANWTLAAGPLTGPGSKGLPGGVAFNRDGSLLAAGDADGYVYVWNVGSRTLAAALADTDKFPVGGVAFSPKGNIVAATTDNNLEHVKEEITVVWDLSTNRRTGFTDPDSAGEFRLTFSPNGNTLAVGDRNASTYLWDMSWLSST